MSRETFIRCWAVTATAMCALLLVLLIAQSAANVPTTPTVKAARGSDFGLEGYCPVTLLEQRGWTLGEIRFEVTHRDVTYLCASERHQKLFQTYPDRYAPLLRGHDPVELAAGWKAVGKREYGLFTHQGVVLFVSEQNLQKFYANPDPYLQLVHRQRFGPPRDEALAKSD